MRFELTTACTLERARRFELLYKKTYLSLGALTYAKPLKQACYQTALPREKIKHLSLFKTNLYIFQMVDRRGNAPRLSA